jgi:phage tail tape-measure protein
VTDDIVTRLRHIYSQKDVGVSLNPKTFVEAADEIERLRAEVNTLKSMISPAPNPEYRYFVHPDAASTYAQLMRGEPNG